MFIWSTCCFGMESPNDILRKLVAQWKLLDYRTSLNYNNWQTILSCVGSSRRNYFSTRSMDSSALLTVLSCKVSISQETPKLDIEQTCCFSFAPLCEEIFFYFICFVTQQRGQIDFHRCFLTLSLAFPSSQVMCGCKSHQQDAISNICEDIARAARENIEECHCPFEGVPLVQVHYCVRYASMEQGDYVGN